MERVDLRRVVTVEVEVGTLRIRSLSLLPGREGEAQEMGAEGRVPARDCQKENQRSSPTKFRKNLQFKNQNNCLLFKT